jgi:hypothetical protein
MTIQRRSCIRRLQLEPLEARDAPSVVSPDAGLLRAMARAEVHKAAHHHVQAARVQVHAPAATSSRSSAAAASSSTPSAGGLPQPIIVVLGPTMQMQVTEVQGQILYEGPAPPPVLSGSNSST